jgi:hypothetical protein
MSLHAIKNLDTENAMQKTVLIVIGMYTVNTGYTPPVKMENIIIRV